MGLYERIVDEPVRTLALREVILMSEDDTVGSAIEAMREKSLGCVIAVDREGRPIGAFTERSVARGLETHSMDMNDALRLHFDERWATVAQNDPIRSVLDGMIEKGTRFVCVTDEDGKATALTGQKGIVEAVAEYFPAHVRESYRRVGAETSKSREGG